MAKKPGPTFAARGQRGVEASDYLEAAVRFRGFDPAVAGRWQQALAEAVDWSRDKPSAQASILDVGCGWGRFIPILASLPGVNVTALDRQAMMTKAARAAAASYGLANVTTVTQEFVSWSPKTRFNFAFVSEVLQLIERPQAFLDRLTRHILPKGVLAIRTPSHQALAQMEWLRDFPGLLEIDLSRHIDPPVLFGWLTDRGFAPIVMSEIDESTVMPTSDYIGFMESRAYSALRLLSRGAYNAGMAKLKARVQGSQTVLHQRTVTFLRAKRTSATTAATAPTNSSR